MKLYIIADRTELNPQYAVWFCNFENYYCELLHDTNWYDFMNLQLEGIGWYVEGKTAMDDHLEFNTEEDMINFLMKWS